MCQHYPDDIQERAKHVLREPGTTVLYVCGAKSSNPRFGEEIKAALRFDTTVYTVGVLVHLYSICIPVRKKPVSPRQQTGAI